MNLEEHINALVKLGEFINAWLLGDAFLCDKLAGNGSYTGFNNAVSCAVNENEWFSEQGVKAALAAISSEMLEKDRLNVWLQSYSFTERSDFVKPVGVIAAGNIPLVCFHDILCVLLSGYGLLLKPSSKDKVLVIKVIDLLCYFEPKLKDRIELTDLVKRQDISGLIATGSDNTARYIEYEYSGVPILSRKNRTSVGVLNGNETEEELRLLANDIFSFFGMGCRNISKLYIPEGYDFSLLYKAFSSWADALGSHPKYISSYKHERAISLSFDEQVVDGELFLLKESMLFNSPLSVIYYEFFSNLGTVKNQLVQNAGLLQCVASVDGSVGNVRFGQTQQPQLFDYADGIDTIQWLTNNIK